MKKILLLLIIITLVTSCASEKKDLEVININATEAQEMITSDKSIIILDVRTQEEFESGHIPGALNVSKEELESLITIAITNRNAKIIVYCLSGSRSAEASKTLLELGYQQVYNMTGGITKWPFEIKKGLE